MAHSLDDARLCSACKSLTFTQLRDGFTHPLKYLRMVSSGKSCQLCRLIVCTMGKLQTAAKCYELEEEYDSLAEELPQLPAVIRCHGEGVGYPLIEAMHLPSDVAWSRNQYAAESDPEIQVRKGNFNDGETIQVTAPENSKYHNREMMPLRSIESASSPRNYQMLRKWLTACTSSHEACRPSRIKNCGKNIVNRTMPTRLIDVGSPEDVEPHPRLLDTNGIFVDYASLSHRWAKKPQLKTTRCNVESHRIELPLDKMPPTFGDAMEITRQLGLRYLWIDSLCIIQGEQKEWEEESQKMGDIFEASTFTIAAMDAIDIDGTDHGLFLPRNLDRLAVKLTLPFDKVPLAELSRRVFKRKNGVFVWKYRWLNVPKTGKQDQDFSQHTVILRPRLTSLYWNTKRSEWYNRGWVLQERMLSRRMIYYTKDKIYWSCFEMTGDEEGGDPEYAIRSPLFSATAHQVLSASWEEIVLDYVRCKLSHNTDRLAAISGISSKFKSYQSLSIHAGIIDDQTGGSLLWHASDGLQNFEDFHAPSWTWASLNGVISFDLINPPATTSCSLIQNLKFETKSWCDLGNPNGLCKGTCISGQVSFTCPVRKIYRRQKLWNIKIEGLPTNANTLSWILGSDIYCSWKPLPRLDMDGNLLSMPQKLLVPDHTELLADECGCVVGFLIPDMDRDGEDEVPIICAGIRRWEQSSIPALPPNPPFHFGPERCEEESIDIIGLQVAKNKPSVYQRVGRGRIICSSWLSMCEKRNVIII